jgi:hypothetical protein
MFSSFSHIEFNSWCVIPLGDETWEQILGLATQVREFDH